MVEVLRVVEVVSSYRGSEDAYMLGRPGDLPGRLAMIPRVIWRALPGWTGGRALRTGTFGTFVCRVSSLRT